MLCKKPKMDFYFFFLYIQCFSVFSLNTKECWICASNCWRAQYLGGAFLLSSGAARAVAYSLAAVGGAQRGAAAASTRRVRHRWQANEVNRIKTSSVCQFFFFFCIERATLRLRWCCGFLKPYWAIFWNGWVLDHRGWRQKAWRGVMAK